MQMQVEAERRKRATILESEGVREADINVAEGKRQSRILASGIIVYILKWYSFITIYFVEAQRMEQINHANGEAAAMIAVAEARAEGLNIVSKSLMLQVIYHRGIMFPAIIKIHTILGRKKCCLIIYC